MKLIDLKNYNLPDETGVYFFMRGEEILYIGKATSLKSRVRSYFDNDILHKRGLHIGNMVTLADNLKWQSTRSVIEAVLLENELIKKHLPPYNTISKDNKSYFVLVITEEKFPRVILARFKDIDKENKVLIRSKIINHLDTATIPNYDEKDFIKKNKKFQQEKILVKKIFGPYPSGQYAKESLKVIRKIFPFRDKCTPYDSKHPFRRNPCFSYQIGLCPGVCSGVCDKKKYNRIIDRLITFLEGDGEKVRADLEMDMKMFAKELKFEDAQKVKEMLFALDHIRDAHLINKDVKEENKNTRIEAFDVAHLSGTHRVGAMSVVLGGVLAKHEYKKFKITKNKNDDLEGLKELFTRRIKHLDWGVPDVVVVDGDDRHVRVVEEILKENSLENIKVVAVTKNKSHKASKLLGERSVLEDFKDEIIMVNAEAHRFSLSYHKVLRKKSFLKN
jgi:excinuclease ABC subunit C